MIGRFATAAVRHGIYRTGFVVGWLLGSLPGSDRLAAAVEAAAAQRAAAAWDVGGVGPVTWAPPPGGQR